MMVVIIFLALPRAAQVLWGPCPCNDSALITGCSQRRAWVQQISKHCENIANTTHVPKWRPTEGLSGGKPRPPLKYRRDIKGWFQSKERSIGLGEVRRQGAALLNSGSSNEVLNSRCYSTFSFSQPLLWLVRDSWKFTTKSCLHCLTVSLWNGTFLYPGTMRVTNCRCDYDIGRIASSGFWILSSLFCRSHFYRLRVQRGQPSIEV